MIFDYMKRFQGNKAIQRRNPKSLREEFLLQMPKAPLESPINASMLTRKLSLLYPKTAPWFDNLYIIPYSFLKTF
jgi:hypothetical protein